MLTRPFTRLVVAFGVRKITQRRLVEELVIGILLLIPFGFGVGLITSRVCTKFKWHRKFIRSDVWTTFVVFLVGDILMEWLLPSLSCLPMIGVASSEEAGYTLREDEYIYNMTWIAQSFGLWCPSNFASSESLLSPDATAILFSLRLVFLCVGVHVGESLCFVALTGGIATGKSTVASIFVEYTAESTTTTTSISRTTLGNISSKRKAKKAAAAASNHGFASSNNENTTTTTPAEDGYREGTVFLICTDTIAHEVILPPNVLKRGKKLEADDESDDDGGLLLDDNKRTENEFSVQPSDSVYQQIIDTFHGKDILGKNLQIDRMKLGAIIFASNVERRKLNRITHPRILTILVRSLLRGVFFGSCDIVMADVPLLFESGKLSWLFGVTICVVTDPDVQLERLGKRNPDLTKKQCQERIDSQLPLSKKAKMADIVIENSGSLEDLHEKVEEVRKDLMGRLYGIGMSLLQMLLLIGGSTSIAVSSKFYTNWQQ
jgi:dephospho-CoA kinase